MRASLLLLALALGACNRTPSQESQDPAAIVVAAEQSRLSDELLLDARDDGARLFATVNPVLPNSDAPRTLRVRWLESGAHDASPWSFDGIPVLDARFIPRTNSALLITETRQLVLLAARTAMPVELHASVYAPLSLSSNGRFAAFTSGDAPDLEVVTLDVQRREVVFSTRDMAPTWCPALSDDGSSVLFVSGASGSPDFFELRRDGRLLKRTDLVTRPLPFPSGPSAPVWSGSRLVFENRDGVHLVDTADMHLLKSTEGGLVVASPAHRGVIVQAPSTHRARWFSMDQGEVAR